MHVFYITLAPSEAFVYRLIHASWNNLCLYNIKQVNSFQRNWVIHPFFRLALLTSRTELCIPGFHCLDQVSHHQQFSCSMLHMQDQTKIFQISPHISPGTVLMLLFLPFICSNLDLYTQVLYQLSQNLSLFFLVSSWRREDKAGKKGKWGITVEVNSFPRIHLKRQISFQDAIVGLLNFTGH